MGKKKVFVRPRPKGKKRTEEEEDALLIKKAERLICQVAKKVKAFEAQHITRNLKQHREKFESLQKELTADYDTKRQKFEKLEEKLNTDLALVKGLDAKQYLVPRGLQKLGLGEQYQWNKATSTEKKVGEKQSAEKKSPTDENEKQDSEENMENTENESSSSDDEDESETEQEEQDSAKESNKEDTTTKKIEEEIDPRIKRLVEKLMNTTAMTTALDSLNEDVSRRRREKLAIFEGRKVSKKDKKKEKEENGLYSYSAAPEVNHRNARTTFLSSLSGGADEDGFGGSDSEEETAQQKNRPGQRARQARHQLEEARKEKKERIKQLKAAGIKIDPEYKEKQKQKWAEERRSAQEASGEYKRKSVGYEGDEIANKLAKKKAKTEAVHSSWEAAKLRKEKEKESLSLPFQGKRKVFGDDDIVVPPPHPTAASTSHASSSSSSYPVAPASRSAAPKPDRVTKKPSVVKVVKQSVVNGTHEEKHPSWIAKQAQVEKLKAGFQGTKIKFNIDDD